MFCIDVVISTLRRSMEVETNLAWLCEWGGGAEGQEFGKQLGFSLCANRVSSIELQCLHMKRCS